MISIRQVSFAILAATSALALAACGEKTEEGAPKGEPIAAIAAPAGTTWAETAVETPEGGFRIGNPEAPLKLVEYASHTCSHCAEFSQKGSGPLDEYVNKGIVSYEVRNLIRDGLDLTIAMLVRCGTPETFHPLANQAWANFTPIMDHVQANAAAVQAAMQSPPATRFQAIADSAGLFDFFAARGISRDQAMMCLADTAKAQKLAEESQKQADELKLTGTPTFILNGKVIEGTSWEVLEPALQAAGAR
ncbi:thioredoxin domain-containing protein [Altererythrobacter sp. Root672]|uniref:thioredoxin domain-containing protein n=1 Tax=Altererythrobacter sp. Root672 TaxID=1736584 RepID=UPI0006F9A7FF|nr:thioredoxin domain-containing protein [Altererythrobacter sp. Root672]KRA82892.1 protein-disulfide isomerase [Altererythrobacter sp. Root672]